MDPERQHKVDKETPKAEKKLARTIADLASSENIGVVHPSAGSGRALAEALQYRPRG